MATLVMAVGSHRIIDGGQQDHSMGIITLHIYTRGANGQDPLD